MAQETLVTMCSKMLDKLKADERNFVNVVTSFTPDKSYLELFTNIWKLKEAHEILNPDLTKFEKCDTRSTTLRNEGNEYYNKNDLQRALELYTRSIMAAKHPVMEDVPQSTSPKKYPNWVPIQPKDYGGCTGSTTALALAYGNRSAVLLKMEHFKLCLRDISYAIKYGYPENKLPKLYSRRAMCVGVKVQLCAEFKSEIREKKTAAYKEEGMGPNLLQKALSKARLVKTEASAAPNSEDFPKKEVLKQAPKIITPNAYAPDLSSAVDIEYVPGKGRSLIAKRNIRTGEVIGRESIFCFSLNKNDLGIYCSYCLVLCLSPLPCPSCCYVAFCTKECRINGLRRNHWIECRLLATIIDLEMENKSLAFMLLKNSNFHYIKSMWEGARQIKYNHPKNYGRATNGYLHQGYYSSIYHLCDNMDKLNFEQMFTQCQIAFVITKMLEKCGRFFITKPNVSFTPTEEDMIATGAIVLSHTAKLNYNPYELIDSKLDKFIGVGICPTLSLINHSCNPNTKHYNFGNTLVLRAIRPIKAGQEVTDSYTRDFSERTYESRRQFLASYFIDCKCEACEEKWGIYENLVHLRLSCLICRRSTDAKKPLCEECIKVSRESSEATEDYEARNHNVWLSICKTVQIGSSMRETQTLSKRDFEFLCQTIDMIYEKAQPPCQTMIDLGNILLRAFTFGM